MKKTLTMDEFCRETTTSLSHLEAIVIQLEDWSEGHPTKLLQDFSNKIGEVASVTANMTESNRHHAGLKFLGKMAEIGKVVGQKASKLSEPGLIPIFTAFFADTIEAMQSLLEVIDDKTASEIAVANTGGFLLTRLQWLMRKVNPSYKNTVLSELEVNQLKKAMGD